MKSVFSAVQFIVNLCAIVNKTTHTHTSLQGKKSLHLQTAYWQLFDRRQNINCVFTCWKHEIVDVIVIIIIYDIIVTIVVVAAKLCQLGGPH